MDNELTYSVMNQDVAWRRERDRRRGRARYWYIQSFQLGARSGGTYSGSVGISGSLLTVFR